MIGDPCLMLLFNRLLCGVHACRTECRRFDGNDVKHVLHVQKVSLRFGASARCQCQCDNTMIPLPACLHFLEGPHRRGGTLTLNVDPIQVSPHLPPPTVS